MVFTQKSSKKRPAPAQGGPKPKKLHVESGSSEANDKKRSRPVTQPLDAQSLDSEPEEEDIDVEDGLDNHEDESAMQLDSKTDEHKIPKDPNGLFYIISIDPKTKANLFLTAARQSHKAKKLLQDQRRAAKPHPPLLIEAKKVWSLVIQKTISTSERQKHVKDLMSVIRGKVKDIVFKYNSRGIVQTVVKHGRQKERDEIAVELKGGYKQLAQNKYLKV